MNWVKSKTKLVVSWLTRSSEQLGLGPIERITLPFKFIAVSSAALLLLFFIGSHYDSVSFLYIWLFLLSMWAILHVKKSTTTWGKFDEIDQREADFAEEVDKRFEQLQKDVRILKEAKKAAAAAVRQEKKRGRKKGRGRKQNAQPAQPTPVAQDKKPENE